MRNDILFSVIIPTYNRAHTLPKCIDSLLSQSYKNWEAIIVDNFSTDDTDQVISKYNDSRLVYIKNANHGIIANSRNVGISKAKGDWLCFLDSDDYWLPSKLSSVMDYVIEYDWIYHDYKCDIRSFFPNRFVTRGISFKKNPLDTFLKNGNIMATSSVCLSRKILGDNRFPEISELVGVEDYLLWLSICEQNPSVKIKHVPKVLSMYGVGDNYSNSSKQFQKEQEIFRMYKDKLSLSMRKDMLRWLLYRKACYLFQSKNYVQAKKCFLLSSKSSSFRIAFRSYKALLRIIFIIIPLKRINLSLKS